MMLSYTGLCRYPYSFVEFDILVQVILLIKKNFYSRSFLKLYKLILYCIIFFRKLVALKLKVTTH